ncbi:response regulator transcription factor [Cyanobacterium stanieri LEGE 03274]|uniref:Response regulator transcription factor n=1 Tax=Cyanobacterium stanieri LEGE 03274 TaxID=1828756 RepID=A0ABR9V1E1_9CHRO|nr:response regulator transcription factor [Cyanobacterium stanieri]MBE9221712.1 response regulator transcription factor [Cyanobacterium stanieri LEGE 03274]
MSKILVVENEQKLIKFLQEGLKYQGYEVIVAEDGVIGLTMARESRPDLIIIDGILPGLSGLEVSRRLRLSGERVPIILLSAQDEINDRVAGLDAGVDDYLVKPFSIEDLLIRLKACLRRSNEDDPDLLRFLDLSLNRRTREIKRGDRTIELTATEYDLLEYLISNSREVLTREQILQRVWGYNFGGDSNIIEVYVRYLRLKLEANKEKRLIQTVRGVGYVLKE